VTPVEFRKINWHQKTRVPGLSYGVVCVILRLAVLVELRLVTDTDRHTDTQTHDHGIYRESIARAVKTIKYTRYTITILQLPVKLFLTLNLKTGRYRTHCHLVHISPLCDVSTHHQLRIIKFITFTKTHRSKIQNAQLFNMQNAQLFNTITHYTLMDTKLSLVV